MPRYKYHCSQCEVSKSAFHLMLETLSDCDGCGGVDTMEKLVSTPHIKKETILEREELANKILFGGRWATVAGANTKAGLLFRRLMMKGI